MDIQEYIDNIVSDLKITKNDRFILEKCYPKDFLLAKVFFRLKPNSPISDAEKTYAEVVEKFVKEEITTPLEMYSIKEVLYKQAQPDLGFFVPLEPSVLETLVDEKEDLRLYQISVSDEWKLIGLRFFMSDYNSLLKPLSETLTDEDYVQLPTYNEKIYVNREVFDGVVQQMQYTDLKCKFALLN